MARAQFEYDEQGNTFYYVCMSFYAIVLLPATYYLWPTGQKAKDDTESKKCRCDPCLVKLARKNEKKTWQNYKPFVVSVLLMIGWAGLAMLTYKVIQLEVTHVDYDPYAILGLDAGATPKDIKQAYRSLSLLHHPDRGGDPETFVKISKAYQALTDEDIRKNWEQYGNPDGPGVTRFGIALPAWIIDKAYSYWVLGLYFLIFMVIMPTIVGVWWYRSIKYSADQVLLDTTQLFLHFFYRSPLMNLKRIIMVLGASFEFDKEHNKDVVIRPTDETEVPTLLKELGTVGENNKERPLCFPYSVKARALLIAHLSRVALSENTLDMDRRFILRKVPALIQEMISVVAQLVGHARAGRIQRTPSVETIENVMKLSAMIVQAVWDNKSPLLQLPHFSEEILRHCVSKKRHVKCCADLANMSEEDRLSLLRSLDPAQYQNIMKVVCAMPNITMEARVEVQDDEDKQTITAGALVTVFVKLIRKSLGEVTNATVSFIESEKNDDMLSNAEKDGEIVMDAEENLPDNTVGAEAESKPGASQLKIWERNKKKKGGKAPTKSKKKPTKPPVVLVKKPNAAEPVATANASGTPEIKERKRKPKAEGNEVDSEDELEDGSESEEEQAEVLNDMNKPADEDDLDFDDEMGKKERILETKSKVTHPVHCPYFPEEKNEWWWLYLCDRKKKFLVTAPTQVTSLVTEEEVELKFPAPTKTGPYSYQICLRSDSYLDCDQVKDIKFEVHEARQITSHPQWDFQSEDDDKEPEEPSDASDYTEDELDDDADN